MDTQAVCGKISSSQTCWRGIMRGQCVCGGTNVCASKEEVTAAMHTP